MYAIKEECDVPEEHITKEPDTVLQRIRTRMGDIEANAGTLCGSKSKPLT